MSTQQHEHASESEQTHQDQRRTVTLGLVPSPEHCERVAERIRDSLSELLNKYVNNDVDWKIAITPDPLSGSNVHASDLFSEVHHRLQKQEWDYAICLTDIPMRRDGQIVVADVDKDRNIGLISVSTLGVWTVSARVSSLIVHIMCNMHDASSETNDQTSNDDVDLPNLSRHVVEQIATADPEFGIDVRYLAPPRIGYIRLLMGMVYANRPWSLFPGFKTTIAAAFATGGYGLIFSTLWEMGDAYGLDRLIFLSFASTTMLVLWIILAHQLWEPTSAVPSPYLAALYNSTTILTIATAVVFAYVVVFLLLLFAAGVFIPTGMLEDTLQREVTPLDYVNIAWVTSSVATIGGAIGAGVEDSETVQNATFGWRQIRRIKQSGTALEMHRKGNERDSEKG